MKKYVLFIVGLFFLIRPDVLSGQIINGQIVESISQTPLAYVHIGVIGKNKGTISNEKGQFSIDLKKYEKDDVLTFSILGYEQKSVRIRAARNNEFKIELKKINYELPSVLIQEKRYIRKGKKEKKIGRKKYTGTVSGGSGLGFGGEMGIKIRVPGKLMKVKDINFRITEILFDSILFRINFYTIKNGLPDQSILTRDLFITGKRGEKWIRKNISAEAIFLEEDVIVSIETVKAWSTNQRGGGVFFNKGILYPTKCYRRDSSLGQWKRVKDPKITLYLSVQKYKKAKK